MLSLVPLRWGAWRYEVELSHDDFPLRDLSVPATAAAATDVVCLQLFRRTAGEATSPHTPMCLG